MIIMEQIRQRTWIRYPGKSLSIYSPKSKEWASEDTVKNMTTSRSLKQRGTTESQELSNQRKGLGYQEHDMKLGGGSTTF